MNMGKKMVERIMINGKQIITLCWIFIYTHQTHKHLFLCCSSVGSTLYSPIQREREKKDCHSFQNGKVTIVYPTFTSVFITIVWMPSAENALTEKFVISFFIFDYYVSFYFNSIKRRGRIEAYSIKKDNWKQTNGFLLKKKIKSICTIRCLITLT
jgi:hypothetical protein